MSETLDRALARLESALAALESASQRRLASDRFSADMNEAFAAIQDDRARLGLELDEALARARRLEVAQDETAERLKTMRRSLSDLIAQA